MAESQQRSMQKAATDFKKSLDQMQKEVAEKQKEEAQRRAEQAKKRPAQTRRQKRPESPGQAAGAAEVRSDEEGGAGAPADGAGAGRYGQPAAAAADGEDRPAARVRQMSKEEIEQLKKALQELSKALKDSGQKEMGQQMEQMAQEMQQGKESLDPKTLQKMAQMARNMARRWARVPARQGYAGPETMQQLADSLKGGRMTLAMGKMPGQGGKMPGMGYYGQGHETSAMKDPEKTTRVWSQRANTSMARESARAVPPKSLPNTWR